MKSKKFYRLYVINESVARVIQVQPTDKSGIFENRLAYYQGEKQGRRLVGGWLRWKTPGEKALKKSGAASTEQVQKADRRQMNFFIDTMYADRLPQGSARHRLINQLLSDHFSKLDSAKKDIYLN